MDTQAIRIPVKAWYGDEEMELAFSRRWQASSFGMSHGMEE